MKICVVVGTRPNFIKAAPIIRELKKQNIEHVLVHTGQHYDEEMSIFFFKELGLPIKIRNFGATDFIDIMVMFREYLKGYKPDMVIVFGDVDSTLAVSLVTSRMGVKLVHIESGCRSFDNTMPEEINRILIDHMSNILFCNNSYDFNNLIRENIDSAKICISGNTMVDSLLYMEPKIPKLVHNDFILLTIHRQSSVDDKKTLTDLVETFVKISKYKKIVFPIHPRTLKNIKEIGLFDKVNKNFLCTPPLRYTEFLSYIKNANIVLTDSGGVQVDAAVLGTPCITLRDNTEHKFTLDCGANILVGVDKKRIRKAVKRILRKPVKFQLNDNLMDGKASERIIRRLCENI